MKETPKNQGEKVREVAKSFAELVHKMDLEFKKNENGINIYNSDTDKTIRREQ